MSLRVLTWNLFHGRALPPRDEDLFDAFAERLSTWSWDVALLQEVPPWWPPALARACGAEERHALTSRNALLPLRRLVARCRPELLKANGGGCNAILVHGLGGVRVHARRRLCVWPERRVVHAVSVRVGGGDVWFANLHASTGRGARTLSDVALAHATALRWAGGAPLVLGGDFNVERPPMPGFVHAGGGRIDHVYARGFADVTNPRANPLDRGALSDHAPLLVTLGR
jgi:endonuclease/exonuclease/phosphatase family metal-dependent hydrolase